MARAKIDDMPTVWSEYKSTGDKGAHQKLVLNYQPLVSYVASRIKSGLPANVEQQDLHSYGLFGLLDAIEKFDLSRNIKFQTYAISRIRGAIIDELRAIDWIPRSVRSRARDIDRATSELEGQLHRVPTLEEVAAHLGLPEEDLRTSYMQVSSATVVALDEIMTGGAGGGDNNLSLMDTLSDSAEDPESSFITEEAKELLARAIERLETREYVVLSLYYGEGLTLQQIGKVLSVTESRVCQLHSQSLLMLRQKLSEAL